MKGSFATRVSGSSDLYKVSIDHETDDVDILQQIMLLLHLFNSLAKAIEIFCSYFIR